MSVISLRWYWFGLLGSLALLAIAYYYFERHLGLPPCPLCMFQRAALVGVAFFCLLGLIIRPKMLVARLLAFFILLSSLFGLAVAGRQVWLQNLPADQVPECGPDLGFMMDVFPFMQMVEMVLSGSGECAEVQWQFLWLTMPGWMLVIFAVMVLISVKLLFKRERNYFSGALGR